MAFRTGSRRPLPDTHLKAIGRVITEFALLEEQLHRMLWELLGLSSFNDKGYTITSGIPANHLQGMIRSYAKANVPDESLLLELDDLLDGIADVQIDRNTLAHATWLVFPKGPIATMVRGRGEIRRQTYELQASEIDEVADKIVDLGERVEKLGFELRRCILG